jgi:thiol-disulfide isomerase/thioredoxin
MKKFLLSFGIIASLGASAQVNNFSVGDVIPDFTVTDVDGVEHSLYEYCDNGQYVMLDFFFDTCPPCIQTTPIFNQLHETYGCNGGDLVCLSINDGTDSDAEVLAFEENHGGSYAHSPAVSADGGSTAVDNLFGITAYPTYCLIGPDRTLVNADIWPISSLASFTNVLPSDIQPQPCSIVNVEEQKEISNLRLFPNPANENTTLTFTLANAQPVVAAVYNVLGERVFEFNSGTASAGVQRIDINTSEFANGSYVIQLQVGTSRTSQTLIVQ